MDSKKIVYCESGTEARSGVICTSNTVDGSNTTCAVMDVHRAANDEYLKTRLALAQYELYAPPIDAK